MPCCARPRRASVQGLQRHQGQQRDQGLFWRRTRQAPLTPFGQSWAGIRGSVGSVGIDMDTLAGPSACIVCGRARTSKGWCSSWPGCAEADDTRQLLLEQRRRRRQTPPALQPKALACGSDSGPRLVLSWPPRAGQDSGRGTAPIAHSLPGLHARLHACTPAPPFLFLCI